MSTATPAIKAIPSKPWVAALGDFRIIPRIETYPAVVSFVQSSFGKIVLLAIFGLGLRYFFSDFSSEATIMFALTAISLMPEHRRFVLALAPIGLLFIQFSRDLLSLVLALAVVALGMVLYLCAMRWPNSLYGRRPVIHLLTGFTLLVVVACLAPAHSPFYSILWGSVAALASYLWFICYAVSDRNSNPSRDFTLELSAIRPLWGSMTTPFPKGAAYLRRIEAQTPEQLAVSQLKGLKLLVWAIMLAVLQHWWNWYFHSFLNIPYPDDAITMSVNGTPAPWWVRWESQVLFFFEITLSIAIFGHRIISICRLAGFNALRNSYRPLSSTTISEYFNRFYYYFKELLVDLFFYPTFLRYFKRHRRLRMFFATLVAIGVGNSFYHLARDWEFFQRDGFWKTLAGYQVLFFYNLLMAAAVGISQLRKRRSGPAGFFRRRILQPAGVLLFYCVLGVFGDQSRRFTLGVHFKYLASLFFIHI